MAIPYTVIEFVGLCVCAGLAVAGWRAPALARGRARGSKPEPVALAGRTRRVRTAVAAVFALLALLAAGLTWAGMPLAPNAQPIAWGGAWDTAGPRLLGFRNPSNPSLGVLGSAIYAYAPDAELRTGITLANDGWSL